MKRSMIRRAMTVIAAAAMLTGVSAGVSSADTVVTLKAGDRIGSNSDAIDLCTVAAVGEDVHGNKLALTAGHCVFVGSEVTRLNATGLIVPVENRTLIGVGAVSKRTATTPATGNQFDYGFVKLNDDVQLVSTGNARVAAPKMFMRLKRVGHDVGFPVTAYDSVTGFTARDFTFTGPMLPGASGGPLTEGGALIGITSRSALFYGVPLNFGQRADAAIADATAAGGVGAGFQPV